MRLPSEDIGLLLSLAGKALELAGVRLQVGVPRVLTLTPAAALVARMVTIKGFTEPGPFLEAARRQVDALGAACELTIPLVREGPRKGMPRRKVLGIKASRIVGFPLHTTGLTAEGSLLLQEHGLGGRRRLGCGVFVPLREAAHDAT